MKTIGILGGLGPESTAAYYEYITRTYHAEHGGYDYPEIVILSLPFAPYIDRGYECADSVREAIERIAAAGADFVVAACNSVHIVYEEVAPEASIPWVSIMDATAESITAAGMKRVGLIGTRFTMTRGFYADALAARGIGCVIPEEADRETVDRVIYDELVVNDVRDRSRSAVLAVMERLAEKGAEGVVLGCTELPFLVRQSDTEIRVFDTTTIHARKALELALEG